MYSLWELINSITSDDLPMPLMIVLAFIWLAIFIIFVCPYVYSSEPKEGQVVAGPIGQEGLESLALHKYTSSEYTYLDNLLNDWWLFAASKLPLWMAPNVVTLLGFASYAPALVCIVYYGPFAIDERPWWVFLVGAIGFFCYQTFDAMDGKHARATGAAGPLGQLFDHGIDAMAVSPGALCVCAALRLDVLEGMLLLSCMQLPFFIAQWGERHIHTLMTSIGGIIGVTEGQYLGIIILLTAAFKGPGFWIQTVSECFGVNGDYSLATIAPWFVNAVTTVVQSVFGIISQLVSCSCIKDTPAKIIANVAVFDFTNLRLNTLILIFLIISGTVMTVFTIASVTRTILSKPETSSRKKCKLLLKAWAELIPTVVLIVLNYAWVIYSQRTSLPTPANTISAYASAGGSFFYHPMLSTFVVGAIFTHITCQMIISAMTQDKYAYFNQPALIPLIVMVLVEFLSVKNPSLFTAYGIRIQSLLFLTYTILVFSSWFAQISWGSRVVMQIAELFGIYVLRVGKANTQPPVLALREELAKKNE